MGIPQVFAIFIQVSQHQEKTRNVNVCWLTKDISLNSNQQLAWSPDFIAWGLVSATITKEIVNEWSNRFSINLLVVRHEKKNHRLSFFKNILFTAHTLRLFLNTHYLSRNKQRVAEPVRLQLLWKHDGIFPPCCSLSYCIDVADLINNTERLNYLKR